MSIVDVSEMKKVWSGGESGNLRVDIWTYLWYYGFMMDVAG